MQVKRIAIRPSLSYRMSLRSLFCIFFEWPFYTGFTVYHSNKISLQVFLFLCDKKQFYTTLIVYELKLCNVGLTSFLVQKIKTPALLKL